MLAMCIIAAANNGRIGLLNCPGRQDRVNESLALSYWQSALSSRILQFNNSISVTIVE